MAEFSFYLHSLTPGPVTCFPTVSTSLRSFPSRGAPLVSQPHLSMVVGWGSARLTSAPHHYKWGTNSTPCEWPPFGRPFGLALRAATGGKVKHKRVGWNLSPPPLAEARGGGTGGKLVSRVRYHRWGFKNVRECARGWSQYQYRKLSLWTTT